MPMMLTESEAGRTRVPFAAQGGRLCLRGVRRRVQSDSSPPTPFIHQRAPLCVPPLDLIDSASLHSTPHGEATLHVTWPSNLLHREKLAPLQLFFDDGTSELFHRRQ
jgi:hypothetical protein